ncbi:MAG: endolytic transglycosylase MltG [bacterium]
MKLSRKISTIIFTVLVILTSFILYTKGIQRPNNYVGEEYFKEIVINKGDSVEDIANLLVKEKLINSKIWFKMYALFGRKSLQAGNFFVPTNINVIEVTKLLGKGTFQKRLTFLEGWRIEQMAEILPKGIQNDFLASSYTKEGFMFPDTYFFLEDVSGEDIAKTLSQNFDEKIKSLKNDIDKSFLSLEEIITIASIVEREAKDFNDKTIIAGILIKRYENDWPLQADATIQYAKDSNAFTCSSLSDCVWWNPLSANDLSVESSYNTYKYAGLPPTPICNPGLSSITAVLEYKETLYWFYLTDNDGMTHYSKTIEEHNENIRKHL